jgi:hypothetical protein
MSSYPHSLRRSVHDIETHSGVAVGVLVIMICITVGRQSSTARGTGAQWVTMKILEKGRADFSVAFMFSFNGRARDICYRNRK